MKVENDKKVLTVRAIQDYGAMVEVVKTAPDEIKELVTRLYGARSSVPDGMPRARNPHAGENVWATGIDAKDLLLARYENARYFILWFEPMWNTLTDDERLMLTTYKYADCRNGIIAQTAAELNYSTRQFNRVREKTLMKLTRLLFCG